MSVYVRIDVHRNRSQVAVIYAKGQVSRVSIDGLCSAASSRVTMSAGASRHCQSISTRCMVCCGGAALWCMVAASLTIEAAWAAAGGLGGLLATAIILGALACMPAITMLPCWNPWFGLMFFLAAFAAGAATLSRHRGWWPVMVIARSIAAQAHLMFTITAVALVVLCLAVGLVETYRAKARYKWAVVGFAGALACWSAPLIQQLIGRSGNLTALASGRESPGPQAGPAFGLKALAASVQPPPLLVEATNVANETPIALAAPAVADR